MISNINCGFEAYTYIRYKRTDLKWYEKFWNYITGHKDRNWKWVPIKSIGLIGSDKE